MICIAGPPGSGKTTLSREMGGRILHTDDYMDMGWSGASQAVADLILKGRHSVVEGVAVPRALRKAMKAFEGPPCRKLIVLQEPRVAMSKKQATMAKGMFTVLRKIPPELKRRGVKVEWR